MVVFFLRSLVGMGGSPFWDPTGGAKQFGSHRKSQTQYPGPLAGRPTGFPGFLGRIFFKMLEAIGTSRSLSVLIWDFRPPPPGN